MQLFAEPTWTVPQGMDRVVFVQAVSQYTFTPIVLNDPELGTVRFVARRPDTTAAKTMPIDATSNDALDGCFLKTDRSNPGINVCI